MSAVSSMGDRSAKWNPFYADGLNITEIDVTASTKQF